ncbi:hypothetical protein EJB05_19799 [Eragrostis curvula]|uniref:Tyrosine--tRNA ligase n=1 Tax=Eragrostis curvula TaxID=38414 RepID=A0A5J9UYG8_9POAL|nr:hypothetical protein EJB05_19799 [Eragrostis curvula]
MLAWAFALAGKGWKRPLNLYRQASAATGRGSDMLQQLRHLHRRPAQLDNSLKEPQQQNNGGNLLNRNLIKLRQGWDVICFSNNVEGSFEQRFATLKSIGEDRVKERELKSLLKKKPAPVCYVWCDPSPWMHISQVVGSCADGDMFVMRCSSVLCGFILVLQGIMKTLSVNKMVRSGCKVKILMADWFSQMNPEIGGSLNKMRSIGLYNIEMWKATGMALDQIELVWLSEEISQHADEYWPLVMDIARRNSFRRIRKYGGSRDPYPRGELTAAEIFHQCLQAAVILFQKVDIWLLDMDQDEANLSVRQYCRHVKRENKPVAVFHYMLPNLLEHPGMENIRHPAWAFFMEDDKDDLRFKIEKAFCPPGLAEGNPCLEYIKYIILPWFGKFEVVRKKENGGKKTFLSIEELTDDYESGALHSSDLKLALEKSLNKILQPVRDHFRSSAEAKDLLEAIEEYYIAE